MSILTRAIFVDPEQGACFSDQAVTAAMLRVEQALATAQAELGIIPTQAADRIAAVAGSLEIPPDRLAEGVRDTGVPVPALVAALKQAAGAEAADWVHFGATSQDIVDTGLVLCAQTALERLSGRLGRLIDDLAAAAVAQERTLMLARTRGQLATPTTLGLRIAGWAQPLIAAEGGLADVRRRALRLQLGGASGNRSALGPRAGALSSHMAQSLGLTDGPPWHTDRSGIRALAAWLDQLVAGAAKIGADLYLSSRGEIAEISAGAGGGSSTMPHKANPVTAEALGSIACAATACLAGLSASAVHAEERDGRHWPVEWLLLPQLFNFAGAALGHARHLVATMRPDAAAMRARVDATPEVMAEAAVFALAPRLGRQAATDRVTSALASGLPLKEALAAEDSGGIDWDTVLDPGASLSFCADIARQIFAHRKR